ncbi:type I fatty acid synthase, partial [Cryptosporidium ryanae]|uniref:type I fatty acid synthase n=1 Tax=Cryptosporidium ryanae TaxID=515981 RepID=UPI003519E2AC
MQIIEDVFFSSEPSEKPSKMVNQEGKLTDSCVKNDYNPYGLFEQFGKNPFYTSIRHYAITNGTNECYSWIGPNGEIKKRFSFMELYEKIVELSWYLRKKLNIQVGERVILCYPPGYDFVIAFLSCIVSGIVAIPVYPPDPMRGQSEIQRFCDIKQISEAKTTLTVTSYMRSIEIAKTISSDQRFKRITFEVTDNLKIFGDDNVRAEIQKVIQEDLKNDTETSDFAGTKVNQDSLAFLQFTSGSTSNPKGVMVTHGNLLFNVHICARSFSFPSVFQEQFSEGDEIPSGITRLCKSDLSKDEVNFLTEEFGEGNQIMSLHTLRYEKFSKYLSILNKFNIKKINRSFRVFSWLPVYHDMGLIGFVCTPLLFGCSIYQMSPIDFIKKPHLWLQSMDKYKCCISGAPNFAFEVTVRKTTKEMINQLNLEHILAILSGAEPIRKNTIEKFIRTFKESGIGNNVIKPAYGLAEHTLIVTGNDWYSQKVHTIDVNTKKLRENNKVEIVSDFSGKNKLISTIDQSENFIEVTNFVSSGRIFEGVELRIVNPETLKEVGTGEIGEIWISSNSVTLGYYNNMEETERVFKCRFEKLNGELSDNTFLRTGDSGFINNDMLYISGRIKDLIIIRGRNFYPQDIEEVVDSVSGVRQGSVAAFSVTQLDGEEVLGIAVEIRMETSILGRVRRFFEKPAYESIVRAISKAVFVSHGLSVHYIWLLSPRTILKTSSGKIRRSQTKDAIFSKKIIPLFEWICEQHTTSNTVVERSSQFISPTSVIISKSGAKNKSKFYVQDTTEQNFKFNNKSNENFDFKLNDLKIKIIDCASQVLGISGEKLDLNAPLHEYGIDSMGAIRLSEMMNEEFDIELDSTLLFNYPTVSEIIDFVAAEISGRELKESRIFNENGFRKPDDIVVVGLSCSFPGECETPEEFWSLLQSGVDAISEIPKDRWDLGKYYSEDLETSGKMYTREGGFIENVELFGASFFKISPVEAKSMDPQQRIFMEKSYEALNNSGYTLETLKKSQISVFVGCCSSDWAHIYKTNEGSQLGTYAATSHAASIIANRVSYTLGLTGSSVTVDSACSASIVALHVSLQELSSGQCIAAVVGGINLILSPQITIALCKARMLSVDCRCKSFDASANGYVRGEGVGVIVLKNYESAIKNGDKIYSIVKGSAVNHNGRSASLTAPNGISQQNVINCALEYGNLRPNDISYVEAHGTGTPLGDPIEISALKNIFSRHRDSGKPLIVGAVKTNIGHLEGAAGMAGIFKVILSLLNDVVPPNLHFKTINPHINTKGFPFLIPTSNISLNSYDGLDTYAGVSSFGFGGTNAHAVFAKPKKKDINIQLSDVEMPGGCNRSIGIIFGFQSLQYVNMGRYYFENEEVYRHWFMKCCEIADKMLGCSLKSIVYPEIEDFEKIKGAEREIEEISHAQCALFTVQFSLAMLLESKGVKPDLVIGLGDGELVAATYCNVISLEDGIKICILRAFLMEKFSVQQMSTLYCTVSKEDVEMALAEMGPQFSDGISIVASFGDKQTLLSGPEEKLNIVLSVLKEYYQKKKSCSLSKRFLKYSYAFGTKAMNNIVEPIKKLMSFVSLGYPRFPIISGMTGEFVKCELRSKNYWGWQLNNEIDVSKAVNKAISCGCNIFLNLMPLFDSAINNENTPKINKKLMSNSEQTVLTRYWYSILQDSNKIPFNFKKIIEIILHKQKAEQDSEEKQGPYLSSREDNGLQKSQEPYHWIENSHSIIGDPIKDGEVVNFNSTLSQKAVRLFSDHKVYNKIVIPGAGLLDIAAAATISGFYISRLERTSGYFQNETKVKLSSVVFEKPVIIESTNILDHDYSRIIDELKIQCDGGIVPKNRIVTSLYCSIESDGSLTIQHGNNDSEFKLESSSGDSMQYCFSCKVDFTEEQFIITNKLDQIKSMCEIKEDPESMYNEISEIGLNYGKKFRVVREIFRNKDSNVSLGLIKLNNEDKMTSFDRGFYFHPAILDGAFHLVGSLLRHNNKAKRGAMVPVSIEEVVITHLNVNQIVWGAIYLIESSENYSLIDLVLFDSEGKCIGKLDKVTLRIFDQKNVFSTNIIKKDLLWRSEWVLKKEFDILDLSILEKSLEDKNIVLVHNGSTNFEKLNVYSAKLKLVKMQDIRNSDMDKLKTLLKLDEIYTILFFPSIEQADGNNMYSHSIDIIESALNICKLYANTIRENFKIKKNGIIPNLWLVTANSKNLRNYARINEKILEIPYNSGLWGLGKSASLEISSILTTLNQPIKCVDIELVVNSKLFDHEFKNTLNNLITWICNFEYYSRNINSEDSQAYNIEREFSICGKGCFVNRVESIDKKVKGHVELHIASRGSISNFSVKTMNKIDFDKVNKGQ